MKILLLGYSSIAQRRVVPALCRVTGVDRIDIASISKVPAPNWPMAGQHFTDYARALQESDADSVYISLPNSMHEHWIQAALDAGKHVIVDKPATMALPAARMLVTEAETRGLILAEATVFDHHPQFAAMHAFLEEAGGLTHIDAQFIIPPMPEENFRSSRVMGGGCLLDMGAYAAGLARQFGCALQSLAAFPAPGDLYDIDMGFSLAAQFVNGVRYTAHFSFESEYQNRLLLVARKGSLLVERLFSPPPDLSLVWHVRRANKALEETIPAADVFKHFLEKVFSAIASRNTRQFTLPLLADAVFRDEIAKRLAQNPG